MLLYSAKPDIKRAIIPQLLLILGLCIIFYLGIVVNLLLLGSDLRTSIKSLIIAILAVLVVMEVILLYTRAKKTEYNFYEDRIIIQGRKPNSIAFTHITNMSMSKNILDKIFKTCTINLEPGFRIRFIKNGSQVYVYLQKLIYRARQLKR